MSIAIKAENISKAYQLGQMGTGTVTRDIERWFAKIRGKEDPFLKIGEANDRTQKGNSDIVWSLKDINFEIQQGDAVGIIGRNGAGKSTLLKLLSRVTSPSTGSIKVKGRIASLLEVGTGFHPELTGKENIYLNGAILGMRKQEIKRKFDEIVDFSGVERYIDTPVKRYSSGMYVRLAFAVAAHLESEILIVDEVLAVGDAEFQKKCLGKMGEVSKGEGRTVLFVSHNMGQIITLCNQAIFLKNGTTKNIGEVNSIIDFYRQDISSSTERICDIKFNGPIAGLFNFLRIDINGIEMGTEEIIVEPDKDINIEIQYIVKENINYRLNLSFYNNSIRIFTIHDIPNSGPAINLNNTYSNFKIPAYKLRPGYFNIGLGGIQDGDSSKWVWNENICSFTVVEKWSDKMERAKEGIVNVESQNSRY